ARTGEVRWVFSTAGPVKAPPTIWESRAYVGSGDGYVYALEAATGRLLWRFRAAPVERHIMVYGNLCSTWPVNTGVLVEDGIAYFAAGIIDYDGTYVYAVDAKTGKIRWQNNSCGHLNPELRKGVSAQGNLTIQGDQLLMAGGNQISPARFDIKTGKCLNQSFAQGNPKANHGKFVGAFLGDHPIAGGRALYASAENVANKDSFVVHNGRRFLPMNFGGIPPAWSDETVALVNFRDGKLICCDGDKALERIEKGLPKTATPAQRRWLGLANALERNKEIRWSSDLDQKEFEVVSLAVCPTSVVAVVKYQARARAHPEWFLVAVNSQNGTPYWFWRYPLQSKPLPGGLLVGRDGQIVLTMLNGNIRSFGPQRARPAQPDRAPAKRPAARRSGAARD
ncbi:MAG: outer membrane protein assembly factor BamB family protein, partial [Planctomycetota bacterium]